MRRAFVAFALFLAALAHAQATNKFKVKLNCDPQKVWIVVNGDEENRFELTKEKGAWRGAWPKPNGENLAEGPSASLQLGGTRTYCRKSYVDNDDQTNRGYVAVIAFDCDQNPTKNFSVTTDPPVPFTVLRTLEKKPGSDDLGCPLVEWSGPHKRFRIIPDVRDTDEQVLLQLFSTKAGDPDAPGLVLNKLKRGPLTPRDLHHALCTQRATAGMTTFASNAWETLDKRLKTLHLTFTVK
jgi:hypothetical protein